MLVISIHHIGDFHSCSLHSVLLSTKKPKVDITFVQWKRLVLGIIFGINYIHEKGIIHNDIKEDNIVLDIDHNGDFKAVLIDFGKACTDGFGKKYKLSSKEIKDYKLKHPHVAPDLRHGYRQTVRCLFIWSSCLYYLQGSTSNSRFIFINE